MDTSGRTPWAVLGLPEDASLRDAHRAFRRLAKDSHPDLGGDPAMFIAIAAAYRAARESATPRPAPTPYDRFLRSDPPVRTWAEARRPRPSTRRRPAFADLLAQEMAAVA